MVFLLAYYLTVSVLCLWAGALVYGMAGISGRNISADRSPVVTMITGLMVLTTGGEWLALIEPVRPWGIVVIMAILHLFAIKSAKSSFRVFTAQLRSLFSFRRPAWYYISFCGLLLLILLFNSGPPRMDDTESYHIQAVKWLQSYGTVPGIANLHVRFGFNSAWFSAIGLLTDSWPGFNNYLSLNGLICCWFCFYLLQQFASAIAADSLTPGRAPGMLLVLLASLLNFYALRRSAASTGYDFITLMALFILFVETLRGEGIPPEWLLWPLFLFTVRLTNFPLLLLPVAGCLIQTGQGRQKKWLVTGLLAVVVILPFLIRNVILSGFPFFPLTEANWFNVDWKSDERLARAVTEYIRYFNRVNPGFENMADTKARGNFGWIGTWWKYLFTPDKITLLAGGLGFVLYFFRGKRPGPNLRLFIAVMFISVAVWFFSAPDPRFILAVFLVGILLGGEAIWRSALSFRNCVIVAFCVAGFICTGWSLVAQTKKKQPLSWLVPLPLPDPPVQEIRVGGITLHIPDRILGNWNPRCYDVALPCLYLTDPRLRPRGSRLPDGFRLDSAGNSGDQPFGGEYIIK